jgi:hypothetical protein
LTKDHALSKKRSSICSFRATVLESLKNLKIDVALFVFLKTAEKSVWNGFVTLFCYNFPSKAVYSVNARAKQFRQWLPLLLEKSPFTGCPI